MKNLFNRLAQWKRQLDYSASVLRAAKAGLAMGEISNGVEILKSKLFSIASELNRAPPRTREIFTEQLLKTTLNNDHPQDVEDLLYILGHSVAEATAGIEALNDPEETKALSQIAQAALRLEKWYVRQDARLVLVLDSFTRSRHDKEIISSMLLPGSYEITVKGKPKTFTVAPYPAGP